MKEETEQAPSWKQDSILGRTVDFELYAQSMETTYQLENQTAPPKMEEPQGPSPQDGRAPGPIPRLST